MERIENHTFDELRVGDKASLARQLTYKDVELFALLSGDVNPAYVDEDFTKSDVFHKVVVHGMWGEALISSDISGVREPSAQAFFVN